MLQEIYRKNKKIIKYAFFGGFGVVTDLCMYSVIITLGMNYQLANATGYLAGTLVSFFLNRHFTFKVKDKIIFRMIKFFLVAFTGYLSSAGLLYILIEKMLIGEITAKILTLFFVLILQFTLNKKVTFKES